MSQVFEVRQVQNVGVPLPGHIAPGAGKNIFLPVLNFPDDPAQKHAVTPFTQIGGIRARVP